MKLFYFSSFEYKDGFFFKDEEEILILELIKNINRKFGIFIRESEILFYDGNDFLSNVAISPLTDDEYKTLKKFTNYQDKEHSCFYEQLEYILRNKNAKSKQ